jgi:hypothetical protein
MVERKIDFVGNVLFSNPQEDSFSGISNDDGDRLISKSHDWIRLPQDLV